MRIDWGKEKNKYATPKNGKVTPKVFKVKVFLEGENRVEVEDKIIDYIIEFEGYRLDSSKVYEKNEEDHSEFDFEGNYYSSNKGTLLIKERKGLEKIFGDKKIKLVFGTENSWAKIGNLINKKNFEKYLLESEIPSK